MTQTNQNVVTNRIISKMKPFPIVGVRCAITRQKQIVTNYVRSSVNNRAISNLADKLPAGISQGGR